MNKPLFLKLNLFLMISAFVVLSSCGKDEDYAGRDDQLIKDYLLKNNIAAQKTASGLYYTFSEPGNEESPDLNSQVTVHYKGFLLNGTVFDSSYAGSAPTFPLSNVIAGWREGLQLFGKGGKGTLYIPSALAYGTSVKPGIPANSVLIFDIHLINIK